MTSRNNIVGLLVGVHFHPPAKILLEALPGGALLALTPEPENEYDPNAIKVSISPEAFPESTYEFLSENLPSGGLTLEQFMSGGEFMLGHVGKSGGKPLDKARIAWPEMAASLVGNSEFLDGMKDSQHRAELGFGPTGDPLIILRFDGGAAAQEAAPGAQA